MKSRAVLLLLAVAACCLMVAGGCSDDDESSPTGGVTTGDPNDSSFQYVQENFAESDEFFDFGGDVEIALALIDATTGIDLSKSPGRTGPLTALAAQEDTVISTVINSWQFTQDRWLVIDFSLTLLEIECEQTVCDTSEIMVAGIDSIRFLEDGVALDTSEVGPNLNGLIQHAHVMYNVDEGGGNTISADSERLLTITVGVNNNDSLLQGDVVINESVEIVSNEGTGSCTIQLTRSQVVDGMIVNTMDDSEGSCPLAGSASVTDQISVSCIGSGQDELRTLDIDGTWQVTAVVNQDRSVTVTFTSNNVQWVVTVPNGECS